MCKNLWAEMVFRVRDGPPCIAVDIFYGNNLWVLHNNGMIYTYIYRA